MLTHTRVTCGLGIQSRHALVTELQRRVLDKPRLPDGRQSMLVTSADFRVYRALSLDFYNGATGRCDPGFRAIKAKANVALGTVSNSTRRLKRAGWITWTLRPRYVHGSMRLCRSYSLPDKAPELRSRFAPKPMEVSKGLVDKSKAQPPARSVAAQLEWLRKEFGAASPVILAPPVRKPPGGAAPGRFGSGGG